MRNITNRDGLDEVIHCHLNKIPYTTTESLKKILARLNFIFDEIMIYSKARPDLATFKIRRSIIQRVVEEFNVSTSQAALDYEIVCEKYQVEYVGFELQYTLKSGLKDLEEDMDSARETGDHSSLSKYHRARAEYLKLLPKEKTNLAALPFPSITMVFDPELVNSSVKGISLGKLYEWVDGTIAKEKKAMSDVMIEMSETITPEEEDDEQ